MSKVSDGTKASRSFMMNDVKDILKWTIFHRLSAMSILLIAAKYVQHFDSSAYLQLILDSKSRTSNSFNLKHQYAFSTLRWDILHFLGIASPRPLPLSDQLNLSMQQQFWSPLKGFGGGLQYENSIAFQPGIIWILRLAGFNMKEGLKSWNPIQSLWITSSLAMIISIILPVQFYL